MGKLIKYLLLSIGGLCLLLVAAGILMVNLDPNYYKDFIAQKIGRKIGRSFEISQGLKIQYYPWLGIEASGIIIGNAKGFGDSPFFEADYLKIRIKTLPLIKKQIEMDTITLTGARINLAKNRAGISNWQSFEGASLETKSKSPLKKNFPAETPPSEISSKERQMSQNENGFDPTPLKNLAVFMAGGLDMRGASIILDDQALEVNYQISGLEISSDKLVPGDPIGLKIAFNGRAEPSDISGIVSFAGTVYYDLDTGKYQIKPLGAQAELQGGRVGEKPAAMTMASTIEIDLEKGMLAVRDLMVEGLGTTLEGNLTMDRLQTGSPRVDLDLDIQGPDLPLLMEMAGVFQEKESSLGSLGRQLAGVGQKAFHMDVNLDVDLGQGSILLPNLSVTGLGIILEGNFSARHLGSDKAVLDGKVALDVKKLSPFLNAFGQKDLAGLLNSISIKAGVKGDFKELQIAPLWARAELSGIQNPKSLGHLTLDTAARVSVNEQTLEMDSFSLKGLGLDARGKLHLQQILTSPLYTGTLSLANFNLRALMKKLNRSLPVTADKRVFKKIVFKTKFSGSADDVNLTELKMTMDKTRVRGEFGIRNFADPDIGFDIVVDKVNADRYMATGENGKKSKKKTQSPLPKTDTTLTAQNQPSKPTSVATRIFMEKLQAFKCKGKLRIEDLIVSKARLQQVKINLDAKNGNIIFAPLSANLYGGTYTGKILLDARGKLPWFALDAALKGVAAEPLLNDVTGKARIRGTGDATASLTMEGDHGDALKKSMNGKVGFLFKNGAVKGFNASQFLRSLKSLGESRSFRVAEEEETDFTDLTGNPVVKNGVVFLNDLDGKSPALRLSGTGVLADLVRETMDYTVNATVVETSKGQAGKEMAELSGITIPIFIKGPLKDPSINPDLSGVIKSFATKELSQKLFEKLGIKSADPEAATDPKTQDLKLNQAQEQEQAPSDPVDILKKSLEKELGNIFKGLSD